MFWVTRYPMISKTESVRVGYWKKYRVAGRVRVPAGHCMFDLVSFLPSYSLSPPPLSFPFLRLPESVAFTICICEHKKGWWTKVVCSQPSQVINRRIPGLRFQISKPCLAVVAVMAQHQAQATYQVNVLVRLVRSWFSSQGCCSTWLQHRRGFIS